MTVITNFVEPDISRFVSSAYRGDSPETRWLIENRLPRGRVVILAAAGGTGKSWLLCELFNAINDGGARFAWGGRVVQPGLPCVILAAEDSRGEIDNRLKTIRASFGSAPKPHGLILPTGDVGGLTLFARDFDGVVRKTDAFEWLERYLDGLVAEFGEVGFLGVDTLAALANFSENDNGEATQVMQGLTQLATKYDMAVVVSHHFAKGSSSDRGAGAIRGASAIVNSARLAFGLERLEGSEAEAALEAADLPDGKVVRLSVLKSNLFVNQNPVALAWPKGSAMIDVSDLVGGSDAEAAMLEVIRKLSTKTKVTKTGKVGIYSFKSASWPKSLQVGRDRLIGIVQSLIDKAKILEVEGVLMVPDLAPEPVPETGKCSAKRS